MTLSINGKTYDADELIAYHKRLEKENELLKADLEFSAKMSSKNKQAVKEYQKLVSEYSSEGADLQDRIKELEKENAELKAVERMALYSKISDRLAKAEELLLELYDCIPSSMADSCKETL